MDVMKLIEMDEYQREARRIAYENNLSDEGVRNIAASLRMTDFRLAIQPLITEKVKALSVFLPSFIVNTSTGEITSSYNLPEPTKKLFATIDDMIADHRRRIFGPVED